MRVLGALALLLVFVAMGVFLREKRLGGQRTARAGRVVARAGAVCNNDVMSPHAPIDEPTAEPTAGTARVDLPLLWRAAALTTGDAGAGRAIVAEVARSHPKPEAVRESSLVASYVRALENWRRTGEYSTSPEPLALDESAATTAARIRSAMTPRTLDIFILRDVLRIEQSVLANALRGRSDVDENTIMELSAGAIDELRTVLSIDAEPMLDEARAAIARSAKHKRRLAMVQFVVFALIAGFLVYVKIDLKRAADVEHANRVPSLVEQFSNPLPDESSESP